MKKKKIVIVGGGAAGLFAAIHAASDNTDVFIYEKNERAGKKLYITGKGRCNITNATDVDGLMENIPTNPYFLYSAFYSFDSQKTVEFFNNAGLQTKVERGNRVFPVSDKASDVVKVLTNEAAKRNVKFEFSKAVTEIIVDQGKACGIKCKDGSVINADAVIIATGGLSYPQTGSTGDGYKIAKKVGHTIEKLYPSLVPLKTKEASSFGAELQGLSLKNVAITLKNKSGKKLFSDFGEMLFTHFGVSGPLILSASSFINTTEDIILSIDLKPALDEKTLDNRLLRDFDKYINKDLKNALDDLLPQKLIAVVIKLSGIDENKKVNAITKNERKQLLSIVKGLQMTITGTTGFDEAVITCGGINVDEINPSTMESKLIESLYFSGEVIDVDAYTGGFNLQIAFSTGYLAGINACRSFNK